MATTAPQSSEPALDYRHFSVPFLQQYIKLREEYPDRFRVGPSESPVIQIGIYLSRRQREIKTYLDSGLEARVSQPTPREQEILSGLREIYQLARSLDQEFLGLPRKPDYHTA
jgi:hypothetical protein